MSYFTASRLRGGLLASTALLALPATAQAQSRPQDVLDQAHASRPVDVVDAPHATPLAVTTAVASGYVNPIEVVDSPNVIINDNFTPTQARDPNNITGIGQVVTDSGGGFIGLCTGSLINPRTILFAAHCVNSRAATAYGANSGGVGIGVGFETNTRANAAGQPDELVNWLTGGSTGPGRFQSNRAQQFYNISQVFYDPRSISARSCTAPTSCFLEADVATAVVDLPTRDVPTWSLLFSPLPTPGSINPATGTGYHVTMAGYGQNGIGTTGGTGSDFRRRTAENMLGALTSISARNLFLFGSAGTPDRPQVLYWLDFDDPKRGTAAANPRDFNGFRDNALAREGITGPGDSGGPLILDQTFAKSVILGVLSGGSTFFAGQPGGSYGTQSFYQPLFLYWDWIVANNPYRYVTATAGNKNWEDATAWVTELDPNYNVISGGQLVNGIPTNIGAGPNGTAPQFGEVCFQSPLNSSAPPAANECENLATGAARNNVPNTPTGTSDTNGVLTTRVDATDAAAPGTAIVASASGFGANDVAISGGAAVGVDGVVDSAQADPGFADTARPAPTIANGLPGATNFTPNNVDGVRTTGTLGRYYDVTLRNAGTVSLNSNVTIDRFSIVGAQSALTVATGASLTSLIDINQLTGIVTANGTVTTPGDYLLMSGLLTGTGRVNTPFLTNVMGNIAPGTLGTIGTLTIGGNLVLSSGSTLQIDLGSNGASDLLAVVATGPGQPGTATLGGRVVFSTVAGSTPRDTDVYTILTATGGRTGTFTTSAVSAILTPTFIYNPFSVQVRLTAGAFSSVVANTPVQRSFAKLLDQNRAANRSLLGGLYDFLDLQNAATIQATLEGLAPRTETLARSLGTVSVDNMNRFYRGRLDVMDTGVDYDGSIAIVGSPLGVLAAGTSGGMTAAGAMAASQPIETVSPTRLPTGLRAFVAGGYIDGDADSMATAVPFGGEDTFDGWYVAGGIEATVGENGAIGFGLSYTDLDGTTRGVAQQVGGKLIQGTLYGKLDLSNFVLDAHVSGGRFQVKTARAATVGASTTTLTSTDNALAVSAEVGAAKYFGSEALRFGPRVAFRTSIIDYSDTIERGGPAALRFERQSANTAQGMAGLSLTSNSLSFKPYASAYVVHDFLKQPTTVAANFVGGVGGPTFFALKGNDRTWGEASLGVAFGSDTFRVSVGADTTLFRKDVSNQAYRGSVSIRF